MPSASQTAMLVVVGCLLMALSACTTSQQTAARLRLHATRVLDSRKPIAVRRTDSDVRVVRTTLLRRKDGTAVVVVLRNRGRRNVNDLPLEVGVRSGGHTEYLNRHRNVPYFQAHAPALAPGQQTTWVFSSPQKHPAGSAFARVGVAHSPPTVAEQLPTLNVSVEAPRAGAPARATISNDSGITQYDLAIFAAGDKGGRTVVAGQASVAKLDPHQSTTVKLKLIGDARGASLHAYAAPTVFD